MLRSCVRLRGDELKHSASETAHRSWWLKFLRKGVEHCVTAFKGFVHHTADMTQSLHSGSCNMNSNITNPCERTCKHSGFIEQPDTVQITACRPAAEHPYSQNFHCSMLNKRSALPDSPLTLRKCVPCLPDK